MSDWCPVALLPNICAPEAVGDEIVALASCHDPRVQAFGAAQPKFTELLSRFTNAFDVPLEPVVLIVRGDMVSALTSDSFAIISFRDLVAMCVIPYARSLGLVYGNSKRIYYSNSFWLYPWMLSRDNEYLVTSTPALAGLHLVEKFHGQSSPELSHIDLSITVALLFDV